MRSDFWLGPKEPFFHLGQKVPLFTWAKRCPFFHLRQTVPPFSLRANSALFALGPNGAPFSLGPNGALGTFTGRVCTAERGCNQRLPLCLRDCNSALRTRSFCFCTQELRRKSVSPQPALARKDSEGGVLGHKSSPLIFECQRGSRINCVQPKYCHAMISCYTAHQINEQYSNNRHSLETAN